MKCQFIRNMRIVFLLMCFIAVLLSGCSQGDDPASTSTSASTPSKDEAVTLRVLVEDDLGAIIESSSAKDNLHSYLALWIKEFSSEHENVEIVIEEIPKEEGREEALQRLRTELMVGEGPDILLLPTTPTRYYGLGDYVESLIPDVQQAMRNGLFLDISSYYDADTELNKDALNGTVMDSGLLEGARYVLPLSYDLPMVCVDKNAFAESGVSQDVFTYNAIDLLKAATQMENLETAGSFYQIYYHGAPLIFNFFPQLIDYETGQVTVTQEELAAYMRAWQPFRVHMAHTSESGYGLSGTYNLDFYYGDGMSHLGYTYWAEEGLFASCDSLLEAADNVLLARTHGVELDMYPMRAIDGSVVADVTLYTAISSGCKNPELAYEFLRHFLSEKFQWQTDKRSDLEFYGWPVRTEGSVVPVCEVALNFVGSDPVNDENITDAELPILNTQIDRVRFSIPLEIEFGNTVSALYDIRNGQAVETDFDQVAADWIKKLQIHADEG